MLKKKKNGLGILICKAVIVVFKCLMDLFMGYNLDLLYILLGT